MGNPTQTPNMPPPQAQPPQYPPRRRRSMAGPIVLIFIGFLFLLGNMGLINVHNLFHGFAHFWPVLLILWGLVKVFEHYRAQQEGYESHGIGAGGVVFLIFLVIFGALASLASKADWSGMDFDMGSPGYTFQADLEQPLPEGASFKAIADLYHGDVVIRAWDENKVKVHVSETVRGKDEATAKQAFENNKPTLSTEGNMVTLRSENRQVGPKIQIGFWNGPAHETNLEIFLPRKAVADLELDHSGLAVSDLEGNLKITTDHGDVSLRDIKGNLDINSSHGDASISGIGGNVHMQGGPGDITINNIGGQLTINSERFSNMSLSKIGKGVHFTSPRTDMDLGKLDGHLQMDEGDLTASSISNGFKVTTRNKDITLSGVSGDVSIDNSHGEVEVQLAAPLGNVDVKNQNASVRVSLPENAAFQLEATSQGGDVDSQFSGISVSESGNQKRATGTVGTNGPRIRIETEHADIEIARGMSGFHSGGNIESKADKLDRKMEQKSDQLDKKLERKSQELDRKMNDLDKKISDQ